MKYKASKAWHYSHELANHVHELVREVEPTDKVAQRLAVKLRELSAGAPHHLTQSLEHELEAEKLACYTAAQAALEDLHRHLRVALNLRYIEREFFDRLERLSNIAHDELRVLIRESYGT